MTLQNVLNIITIVEKAAKFDVSSYLKELISKKWPILETIPIKRINGRSLKFIVTQ